MKSLGFVSFLGITAIILSFFAGLTGKEIAFVAGFVCILLGIGLLVLLLETSKGKKKQAAITCLLLVCFCLAPEVNAKEWTKIPVITDEVISVEYNNKGQCTFVANWDSTVSKVPGLPRRMTITINYNLTVIIREDMKRAIHISNNSRGSDVYILTLREEGFEWVPDQLEIIHEGRENQEELSLFRHKEEVNQILCLLFQVHLSAIGFPAFWENPPPPSCPSP